MRLTVNGQSLDIAPESAESFTVDRLLREFPPPAAQSSGQVAGQVAGKVAGKVALDRRAACAVEVNRRVIPRCDHATATLVDGDMIEIVTFVGGG